MGSTATTSSPVLLFLLQTPSACTSTPSGKLLPSMSGCTTAAPSSWLFSTSSSASTPTWVVSGNSPTAWACAPGSALLTAHPSLQPLLSSWFTPSVRAPSLTQCPWASLAPSTTCWCSRPSTTSCCTPSTCWASQVSSAAACSPPCTAPW